MFSLCSCNLAFQFPLPQISETAHSSSVKNEILQNNLPLRSTQLSRRRSWSCLQVHIQSVTYIHKVVPLISSGPLGYVSFLYFKLQWPVGSKRSFLHVFLSLCLFSFTCPLSHHSSYFWIIISFRLTGIICNLCKPWAVSHSNAKAYMAPISWGLRRNLLQTSYNPITHCLAGLTLFLLHWFCHCCPKGTSWPFAFLNRSVCVCLGEL